MGAWNFEDLTGKRYGKLTVVERTDDYVSPSGNKIVRWVCVCDCGNNKIVNGSSLKRGSTESCGCLHSAFLKSTITKHGMCGTRLYRIWRGIITRCKNKNNRAYSRYGGRGITVCDEWAHNFESFYKWSITHGYADDLSIDRIDNNKGYSPDNCRWAGVIVQANNMRSNRYLTYNGKTQTVVEWARELNIPYGTLKSRVGKLGWSVEDALGGVRGYKNQRC